MCDVKIYLMVRDPAQDKITSYCSGTHEMGNLFTMDRAIQALRDFEKATKKSLKIFTDNDYSALDTSQYWRRYQEKRENNKKRQNPRNNSSEETHTLINDGASFKAQKIDKNDHVIVKSEEIDRSLQGTSSGYRLAQPGALNHIDIKNEEDGMHSQHSQILTPLEPGSIDGMFAWSTVH